jgi:hypothetical protein
MDFDKLASFLKLTGHSKLNSFINELNQEDSQLVNKIFQVNIIQ